MFDRIKPMRTIHDHRMPLRSTKSDLRNPLCRENKVWRVIPPASLINGCSNSFSRPTDVTGILDDIARAVGPPTAMCVLGSNVIGAADWEQIPFAKQYQAVTMGAGAFVASNMLYLRISGPDATAVLNMLTPRNMYKLAPGRAMFVLFTTPAGTVDEEAIKAEVRELMKTYRTEIKKTETAANVLEPYYREMYTRCADMDVGMNYWVSSKEAQ